MGRMNLAAIKSSELSPTCRFAKALHNLLDFFLLQCARHLPARAAARARQEGKGAHEHARLRGARGLEVDGALGRDEREEALGVAREDLAAAQLAAQQVRGQARRDAQDARNVLGGGARQLPRRRVPMQQLSY
jgi:hypothetical protein